MTMSGDATSADPVTWDAPGCAALAADLARPLRVVRDRADGRCGLVAHGLAADGREASGLETLAVLPAAAPQALGDHEFRRSNGLRYAYAAGEMAHGIAGPKLVVAMARLGALGFVGTAGLDPARVEALVAEVVGDLGPDGRFGFNLIHSPADPALEERLVGVYLAHGVRRMSASAFMGVTKAVVRFAVSGLRRAADGVERRGTIFAKVSRPEIARAFLSPAPEEIVAELVRDGHLQREEAELARHVPLAEAVTVEADSAGHTDQRPLVSVFPAVAALRDELAARYGYVRPIHVGAAGGIGTPSAAAAAFAMGAAYVLTGSVNQSCVEANTSDEAKRLLAGAGLPDVAMAPAADMFELGVRVQVLRRGTMFAGRAARLFEVYAQHESLEAIPAPVRTRLERDLFRAPLESIWDETRRAFAARAPAQIARAETDPKHKLALVCRWYLGMSSRWAQTGDPARKADYQIWCGPAAGAFNEWAAGSPLADPSRRTAPQVALNFLHGAAHILRAQTLRACGVPLPASSLAFPPRLLPEGTPA